MIRKNLRNRVSSRNSNKALYESIMKDVAKTVKKSLNENASDKLNDVFYGIIFNKINYAGLSISEILQDDKILAKVAGSVVEEQIKQVLKYTFTHNAYDDDGVFIGATLDKDANGLPRFVDGGNNWWDFSLDGEKVEIKAF